MAEIVAARINLSNGNRRGNEVQFAISPFCTNCIFPCLGHVAINALTSGAFRGVANVFGGRVVISSNRFGRTL